MDEEQAPPGRTASFITGAYSAHTMQQGAGTEGYHPTSTLTENQILTPANGMSAADRARQPVKGPGQSINGQSESTFQSRMWLGSAPRTFGG